MAKRSVRARKVSQTFFFILFVYILWSTTYPLTGILPPAAIFRIDPLVTLCTSLSERVILPGFLLSVSMLVFSALFGRFFCGWVCPLGSAIDAVGDIRKRVTPEDDAANRRRRVFKFYILGAIVIAALSGRQLAWAADPIVIAARFVSLNLIPAVTSTVNGAFILLIKYAHIYMLQDIYRPLRASVLGVNVYYFAHAGVIFCVFALITAASLFKRRLWCRSVCPLGALYAFIARIAPLRRVVTKCSKCAVCKSSCRMGAIRDDMTYSPGECILCMDCVYECPQHGTRFAWYPSRKARMPGGIPDTVKGGISRRKFLFLAFSPFLLLVSGPGGKGKKAGTGMIRPPAALKEEEFLDRCIRCGNCMKVCITNGLQPVMFEAGLNGLWTPRLVPEIGYCEYQCTLCGHTCPTGAIPKLSPSRKRATRLGVAEIDRSICIPWAQDKECIVCQEHCPVPDKAIKLQKETIGDRIIAKPVIDEYLCVGCGICQNKCPVRPVRAVRVSPRNSERT
ncbi:MAG: 4Fe-4S binding protein [Candidatus Omnitrophota bacterium]